MGRTTVIFLLPFIISIVVILAIPITRKSAVLVLVEDDIQRRGLNDNGDETRFHPRTSY